MASTRHSAASTIPRGAAVHAYGRPAGARIEESPEPERVDHVWIDLDVGLEDALVINVNTLSRKNLLGGFDPRVYAARIYQSSVSKPAVGLRTSALLEYEELARGPNLFFEPLSRLEMESLLLDFAGRAIGLEAWGELYRTKGGQVGIHQIHSRRASCAVGTDLRGHDGGLRFHFGDGRAAVMLLLKFSGQ
ncbi:MAG: hypothetical protein SNJ52_00225 [Verrucomicrobiia bacterium]